MTVLKERGKERLSIMRKIDLIEEKHCIPCPINKLRGNRNKKCEGCTNFNDINKLGEELNKIAIKNKKARSRKTQVKTISPKREKIEVKELGKISIEMYQDYRAAGKKDTEIAKLSGMTTTSLYQFKSINGLSNKRSVPAEVAKEVPEPIEAATKIPEPVEPVNTVKEKPKGMPTIESSWNPLQDSINCYYENHSEKSAALKENAKGMINTKLEEIKIKPIVNVFGDSEYRIKFEYEAQRLQREIDLQKELKTKAESQLNLYIADYRNVVDEREHFKNRLELLLPEMEDLQTMNLIMMKKMISVDTVLKERGF
jgi:hypothetical protein